nr:hypothetical protein Iba_chr01cCG5820 [Ipomoea batatas]
MQAISSHVPDAIVVFLTKAILCLEFGDQRSEVGMESSLREPLGLEQGGCCCSGVSVVDECCWWWMRFFYAGGLGTLSDPVMVPGGLRFGAGALHGLEPLANAVVFSSFRHLNACGRDLPSEGGGRAVGVSDGEIDGGDEFGRVVGDEDCLRSEGTGSDLLRL